MCIVEMKAKKVFGGPGSFVWIAEAEVESDGKMVYVTVEYYDGEEYTVSEKSMYDFLADDGDEPCVEFLEEYANAEEAGKSKYAAVFEKLREAIDRLE